jgi:hypothetical protein
VSLDRRLARLEAEGERPPVVFRVRWDSDDDDPGDGPRIRLQWGDADEPRKAPETT